MMAQLNPQSAMVRILREADRGNIGEVAKRHGISDQTIDCLRGCEGTF